MDALTEALNGVRLRSTVHCPSEMSGQWGLRVESKGGALFYIVLHGSGWLEIDGMAPVQMAAGDFAILPHDTPHTIKDAPNTPARPLFSLLKEHPPGQDGIWRLGGGGGGLPVRSRLQPGIQAVDRTGSRSLSAHSSSVLMVVCRCAIIPAREEESGLR